MEGPGNLDVIGPTLAKYLHTVSAAALRSWLKGHAEPAWQAPWRKNLHGTCDVSGKESMLSADHMRQWVFLVILGHKGQQLTRWTARMVKSVCSWQLAARQGRRNHGRGSTRPGLVWVDVETA